MKQNWRVGILIVTCLMMNGCHGESERMANLAEKTVSSQNEANVANAKTQNNFVNLTREFQQERSNLQIERQSLNQQFQNLETDRSNLHQLRRSELAWAESLRFLAIVIAAIMPLFLCAYLVWAASRQFSKSGGNQLDLDQGDHFHSAEADRRPELASDRASN